MEYSNQTEAKQIRVSIIMATYNAAEYLAACLESISRQGFKDIELIIMDGGSTDGTLEIIKSYKDAPCIYKSEPDTGIYNAFNKAVKLISGQWCLFLGADDRLLDGFSHVARHLINPSTLYYGDYRIKGIRSGEKYSNYQMAKKTYCHQAIFYPANVLKTEAYNEDYKVFADYDLNIKCWGASDLKKEYVPLLVVDYNPDGFSSYTNDRLFRSDKPGLVKKHLGVLVYLRYRLKKFKESGKRGSKFF